MTTDISPTLSNKLPPNYIPMTPQMVFNAAWQAFIVENKPPAVFKNTSQYIYSCVYRSIDGHKCAIGLCLPEGHKATNIVCDVQRLQITYPELFSNPNDRSYRVLQKVLHDSLVNTQTGKWKYTLQERSEEYRRVAKVLGLTVPSDCNIK